MSFSKIPSNALPDACHTQEPFEPFQDRTLSSKNDFGREYGWEPTAKTDSKGAPIISPRITDGATPAETYCARITALARKKSFDQRMSGVACPESLAKHYFEMQGGPNSKAVVRKWIGTPEELHFTKSTNATIAKRRVSLLPSSTKRALSGVSTRQYAGRWIHKARKSTQS